jgi:IclR family KDG regulon transcriptional repressor
MPQLSSQTSASVNRVFSILELMDSTQRNWSTSEISRRLDLPKSTTHILMVTLARLGYVTRDPVSRKFSLSFKLSSLGHSVIKDMLLPKVATPFMRSLAQLVRLTVNLAILEKRQAIYVQKVDGPGLIRFDIYPGKRTNLHCTAVGKVLLAYSSPQLQRAYLSGTTFIRHTKRTISSSPELVRELAKIVRQGWAMDDEEEELDVRCLAVPVYGQDGSVIASLGISGTVGQIGDETIEILVSQLKEVSHRIQAATHTNGHVPDRKPDTLAKVSAGQTHGI